MVKTNGFILTYAEQKDYSGVLCEWNGGKCS